MKATSKQQLFDFCQSFVAERLARIQQQIKEIQRSLTTETKSSAGDKHETGRAMLQLEREKLGQQLAEAEKMQQTLLKVPQKLQSEQVCLGSWVKTSQADYFLSISAGAFQKSTYCISAATPIGRLLIGKSVGDKIQFNKQHFEILEIV